MNKGGAGARGIRYDGSAAGTRGEGYDARLDAVVVTSGDMLAIEAGRDGKSCESLSDPDVFLRVSAGRAWDEAAPTVGEPTRRAVGTLCSNGPLPVIGEPICSGDGTPSIAVECWVNIGTRRSHQGSEESIMKIVTGRKVQTSTSYDYAVCKKRDKSATPTSRELLDPAAVGALQPVDPRSSASRHSRIPRLQRPIPGLYASAGLTRKGATCTMNWLSQYR